MLGEFRDESQGDKIRRGLGDDTDEQRGTHGKDSFCSQVSIAKVKLRVNKEK